MAGTTPREPDEALLQRAWQELAGPDWAPLATLREDWSRYAMVRMRARALTDQPLPAPRSWAALTPPPAIDNKRAAAGERADD